MNKSSLWWRVALIVAVLVGWAYALFPVKDRDFMQTFERLAKPRIEALRKAGDKDVVAQYDRVMGEARTLLTEKAAEKRVRAPYLAVKQAAKGAPGHPGVRLRDFIPVPGQNLASNELVLSYVRREATGRIRLGLDIRGGTEFVIGFNEADVPHDASTADIRKEVQEILERRVNALGVAEPEIKPIGPTSISVRMPSVTEDDKLAIRDLLRQAGKLEFHIVHPENQRLVAEYQRAPTAFVVEPGYSVVETEPEGDSEQGELLFIKKAAEPVRGADVDRAQPSTSQFGGYEVLLRFNNRGAAAFGAVTAENVGRRMAIMLDGKVYSAPNIRDAITGGSAQISGSFTAEEVQRLASILNGGRMRVQTRIDSEFGTDPTLGADSIKAGIMAALWGTIAVVLFMLIYYRMSGMIAIFAMICNILIQIGTMAILGATFTLPGIAGIVLTIGMAVDANILIYERFREEIAAGKAIANAIDAGFSRAFWTIFDSHVTALITGLILYWYGTGPVKGFAVALSIGLVANLFTSLVLSRAIYDLILCYCPIKKLTMLHIFSKVPHIDFMGMRRKFFTVSGILTLAAVLMIAYRFYNHEALSTDFTGGVTMTYQYNKDVVPPPVDALRAAAAAIGLDRDVRIGYKSAGVVTENLLEITISAAMEASKKVKPAQVLAMLKEKFPQAQFSQKQTYQVGGLVGKQFKWYAICALVLSWLAIILYLAFRFEFAYGVAAVIAIVHDVIVAAGVAAFCDKQLSLTVLAALLTIIGYSVNDTIVVFDRIRENFSLARRGSYTDVVNLSINQTLSRTLLTSMTVFFCVLSLYLFGGGAINDFALIMLAGVVVGTYSSVFIASAIIVSWHKRRPLTPVAAPKPTYVEEG